MALVLGVALAGCTGDNTATPTTTPTVSPSTSPTPTLSPTPEAPQPPVRPEAMATNDEAGAVAAAQYFMGDLYWYMYATGDSAEWEVLADDGCIFCSNVLSDVGAMVAAGSTDIGQAPRFETSYGTTISERERFTATVTANQPASQRVTADGTVIDESAGGRYELHFAIRWQGTGWSILAVDATRLDEPSA